MEVLTRLNLNVTLMTSGICEIRRGCNIPENSNPNHTSGGAKAGEPLLPWQIKKYDRMSSDHP